ncbi:hypothetical protein [Streptomyces sp. NPDC059916]
MADRGERFAELGDVALHDTLAAGEAAFAHFLEQRRATVQPSIHRW